MKFAEQLCERTGFVYDPDAYLYYKEIDGYQFAMSFYSSQFYLMSCVCLDGAGPQAKQIKKDVKENDEVRKAIKDVSVQGYRTVYIIKPALSQAKLIENIDEERIIDGCFTLDNRIVMIQHKTRIF